MGDINNDKIEDIAITVQPSDVIGLSGNDGKRIWTSSIAKPYEVERDNKIIGASERNIWDVIFLNSKLVLTGEDGYIYQVNPNNGNIINEKELLAKIPNILAYSLYLEGNKAKEYSGLSINGNSAFKIINTHEFIDSNNDLVNDLIVTIFEPNKYASFSNMISSIYLLDGKTLDVIWEKQLDREQIFNLNLDNDGVISYFDGTNINIFNVKDIESETEVLIDTNNPNTLYPLLYEDKLIINNEEIQILDISDINNPLVLNTINYFDGYDTITKNSIIYKIYYQFDKKNKINKNYKMIESINYLNEILWSYDLEDNTYFNKYYVQTIDNENIFLFINNNSQLITIDANGNLHSKNITSNIEDETFYNTIYVLTECTDYNQDGYNDILIVFQDGVFLILNSLNVDEVIYTENLHSLFDIDGQYFTHALPLFIDGENKIAVISNEMLLIISFEENMDFTVVKEVYFDNYQFFQFHVKDKLLLLTFLLLLSFLTH